MFSRTSPHTFINSKNMPPKENENEKSKSKSDKSKQIINPTSNSAKEKRIPSSFESSSLTEAKYIVGKEWVERFMATKVSVDSPESFNSRGKSTAPDLATPSKTTEKTSDAANPKGRTGKYERKTLAAFDSVADEAKGFEVTIISAAEDSTPVEKSLSKTKKSHISYSEEEEEEEVAKSLIFGQQHRSTVGCYPERDTNQQEEQQKQKQKQKVPKKHPKQEEVKKKEKETKQKPEKKKKQKQKPALSFTETPTVLLGAAIPPDYVNYYAGKKDDDQRKKTTETKKTATLPTKNDKVSAPIIPSDAPTVLVEQIVEAERKKQKKKATKPEGKNGIVQSGVEEDGRHIWQRVSDLRRKYQRRGGDHTGSQLDTSDASFSTSRSSTLDGISTLSSPSEQSAAYRASSSADALSSDYKQSPPPWASSGYIGRLIGEELGSSPGSAPVKGRRIWVKKKKTSDGDECCCCC